MRDLSDRLLEEHVERLNQAASRKSEKTASQTKIYRGS